MGEGRRCETWNFYASLIAFTGNCHRDPKKSKPITPADIHPFFAKARKEYQKPLSDTMAVLKANLPKQVMSNAKFITLEDKKRMKEEEKRKEQGNE